MFDHGVDAGDNSPWVFDVTCLIGDNWEAVFDYQDYDDAAETTEMRAGFQYFINGVDTRWQLNFVTLDSDDTSMDGSAVVGGLVLRY